MDEFYKGENTPEESLKRVLLRLSCPKNASIPYLWFLAETEICFDSFGQAAGPGREDRLVLSRDEARLSPEKYCSSSWG